MRAIDWLFVQKCQEISKSMNNAYKSWQFVLAFDVIFALHKILERNSMNKNVYEPRQQMKHSSKTAKRIEKYELGKSIPPSIRPEA